MYDNQDNQRDLSSSGHQFFRQKYNSKPQYSNTNTQNNFSSKRSQKDESQISMHRIDRIEDVVNKLTNQYDALMPLLNLVENAPLLIKKENLIANLQKKHQQTEERSIENKQGMEKLLSSVEIIKQDLQNQLNNEMRNFENKFYNLENKMNEQLRIIQNNENKINKQVNKIEGKQREELQISMRKYDNKYNDLDNQMKQLNVDVQEKLQQYEVERQKMRRSTVSRRDSNISNKNVNMNQVESQVEKKLQEFTNQLQKQLEICQTDMGLLYCQQELSNQNDKKHSISEKSKMFPKDIPLQEKMMQINNLELTYQMQNLDRYNIENTQRIINELQQTDEQILVLESLAQNQPFQYQDKQKELEKLESKIFSLKGQIEGSFKKVSQDVQKLEDKYLKVTNFLTQSIDDKGFTKNKHKEDDFIQSIQIDQKQKIDNIKNDVQENITLLYENLSVLQEKYSKFQTIKNAAMQQYSYMQSEITQNQDNNNMNNSYVKNRMNSSYSNKKQNRVKDSFVKRSFIQQDYNRSTYTQDESMQ